jgi:hypothetical protein
MLNQAFTPLADASQLESRKLSTIILIIDQYLAIIASDSNYC